MRNLHFLNETEGYEAENRLLLERDLSAFDHSLSHMHLKRGGRRTVAAFEKSPILQRSRKGAVADKIEKET